MKTRVCYAGLVALGTLISAQAQGRLQFSNNFIPPGATAKALITRSGEPVSRQEGRVQVLNAADGLALTANGEFGVPLVLDGLFFIKVMVPGVPAGESLTVVLRAWRDGRTYEEAAGRAQFQFTVRSLLTAEFGPGNALLEDSSFAGLSLTDRAPAGGFQLQTPTRSSSGTWSIPVAMVAQAGPVFQSTHAQLWSSTNLTHWTRGERRWFFAEPGGSGPMQVLTAPDTGQTQWFKLEW